MYQIRCSCFETNSSSTHSINICTEEQYQKWYNNECYYDEYSSRFLTKDELLIERPYLSVKSEQELEEYLYDNSIYNFDSFIYHYEDLDFYHEQYVTPKGENITVFGYYGSQY